MNSIIFTGCVNNLHWSICLMTGYLVVFCHLKAIEYLFWQVYKQNELFLRDIHVKR